ncbi:unannotated protein [freshwater metagenome]|uniref:Unannotated protein n=1 Tax=freshwater metagenome TaxID=449393 RepID=A0A6J7KUJ1_9ZZZZ
MITTAERPSRSGSVTIDASYLSLTCGAIGALVYGLGCLAVWITPEGTRLAWGLQVVGPLLVAVGLSTQLEHMARRIGSWAVRLGIIGLFVWAVSGVPFLISPESYASPGWNQVLYLAWSAAYLLFALALFLVLGRKESRLEQGGATGDAGIHASFSSLTLGAVGWMLFGLGFLAYAEDLVGTRFAWGMQAAGPILLALALATHLDHLARRLGVAAVTVAIVGAGVWSLTTVAFVFDPPLAQSATWGPLCFWGVYGAGIVLGGVSGVLVIARKARATRGRQQPPR